MYQDRILRFLGTFAQLTRTPEQLVFIEALLAHLVELSYAKDHGARWRACQLVHCIMCALPEEADMSDEVADAVQDAMLERLEDTRPNVRCAAVRALARLPIPDDDGDFKECPVTVALLDLLSSEKSKEVRKAIVASLPDAPVTRGPLMERTLDESDDVRKVTYISLAEKVRLQDIGSESGSLMIRRGLGDRVDTVSQAASAMVASWLDGTCEGEPLALLRIFDVEKHPKEAENALKALISSGRLNAVEVARLASQEKLGLRATFSDDGSQLMSSEEALFWRVICEFLASEATDKGLVAASTLGANASIEAAAAGDRLEALENALPASVEEMIEIVEIHGKSGYRNIFASSQLMQLAANCMDFTDATGRRAAANLLAQFLSMSGPAAQSLQSVYGKKSEQDKNVSNIENLDALWRESTSILLRKVYASPTELAQAMLEIIKEIYDSSGSSAEQSMHTYAWIHMLRCCITLLESLPNAHCLMNSLKELALEKEFHNLIEGGLNHSNDLIRKDAVRCLGLYWLLDCSKTPVHLLEVYQILKSEDQASTVKAVAIQAIGDIALQRGVKVLDQLLVEKDVSEFRENAIDSPLLSLYLALLENWKELSTAITTKKRRRVRRGSSATTAQEVENVANLGTCIVEGVVRLIAVNEFRQSIDAQRNELTAMEDGEVLQILVALLLLGFDPVTEAAPKLRQCLTVFFERFASLSLTSQQYIATATMQAARSALTADVVAGRKTSTSNPVTPQVLRFIMQLLQLPVFRADGQKESIGHEPLAELIMGEIISRIDQAETPKYYLSVLCKMPLALPMYDAGEETRETMMRIQVYASAAAERMQDRTMKKDLEMIYQRYAVEGVDAPQLQSSEIEALVDGVVAHLEAFCKGFSSHSDIKCLENAQRSNQDSEYEEDSQIGNEPENEDEIDHEESEENYSDSDQENEEEQNFVSKMSTAKARARRASAVSVDALRTALQENVRISDS